MVASLVAQVAPAAQLMPLRVLDGDGSGIPEDVAAAVDWAAARGADVVQLSLGTEVPAAAIEAAAAGLPVVAVRVGGIPEIFGDQADRLVKPDDAGALAAAISAALDDPAGLARQTSILRDRVRQKFSQDAMVNGVLDGYIAAQYIVT